MGARSGPYQADVPEGTLVRIRSLPDLERFRAEWKYHHPIQDAQHALAGICARVRSVGFYHGGDELYELEGVPGTWHECCLEPLPESESRAT